MKKRISRILLGLALTAVAVNARAVVLNFDDIEAGSGVVAMPSGYGGLTWDSNIGIWGFPQDPYNPKSPPNRVLFNLNGETGVGESHAAFIGPAEVFDGAYFSGGEGTAQLKLYNGATLVATSSVLTLGSTPTFLASGYSGPVTSVGIVGNDGAFAMDDFTFHPIPEPSSFGLIALGFLASRIRLRPRVGR